MPARSQLTIDLARPSWRYLFAVATVAFATLLGLGLRTLVGPLPAFIVFYPSVLVVATVAGGRAGILAALLSAVSADYWFIPPFGQSSIDTPNNVLALSIFVGTSLFLCMLTDRLRRAESAARVQAEDDYRESELTQRRQREFLECVVANSDSCIAVLKGHELRYTMANARFQAFVPDGLLVGRTYREVFPEAAAAGAEALLQRVMETGEPWNVDAYQAPVPGKPDATWQGRIVRLPVVAGEEPSALAVVWDVTDRKRAEAASDAHRRLLETVFDHMPAAVNIIRGRDLRMIMANPAYRAIAPGKSDIVGKTLDEIWPETSRDFSTLCRRVLETGEPYHAVDDAFTIQRWPGGPLEKAWFTWSLHRVPLPGDDGWGIFNAAWETTARHEVEVALQEREAMLEAFFAASPGILNIEDEELRYVKTDKLTPTYFGLTRESIVGKAVAELAPAFIEQFGPMMQRVIETGVPAVDVETQSPVPDRPGEMAFWRASYFPVPLPGGRRGIGIMGTDITGRKRAEEALQQNEERLRLAQSAGKVGIWDWDLVTQEVHWTPEIDAIYGMEPGTIRSYGDFAARVHPDDAALVDKAQRDAVAGHKDFDFEFRIRRFDEAIAWIYCRGKTVYDETGRPLRAFGINLDITERKRADDELRAAKAAAEEANRQKDHFLAVLGHELRNPLAPIRNSVALLKRIGPPDPTLQRAREMIDRQVSHMTRLIDDLLDVSRISSGKAILRKEEMDLTEVVLGAVEDHRPMLEANGLTVEFHTQQDPVGVLGDPARITQIVGNLLTNASKFTDRGGRVDVTVTFERENQAIIRVSDTGIGIEPDALARLFEPFSQADRSLDRSRGGLGLGLALVKGLVELHGGRVEATSAGPGHGSQFTVSLPGVVRRVRRTADQPSSALQSTRPQRILVIEDNVDAAETLQALLEVFGHTVVVAHSGPEGLEKARVQKPEVILCDIGLPGMDGYEVGQAVRRCDDLKSVLLIAMTGYGLDEDRKRARAAGFDHHLTKPADPQVLERLLVRQ